MANNNGDQMSAMTDAIRQAVSRKGFDNSPVPSLIGLPRSRAGSTAGSIGSGLSMSRRGSLAPSEELSMKGLSLSSTSGGSCTPAHGSGMTRGNLDEWSVEEGMGRRSFDSARGSSGSHEHNHGFKYERDGRGGETDEKQSPIFDPGDLLTIRRLGEGTGGAVELVEDKRTGRVMAKKVSQES